ncbi:MAG: protease complex subunit PrcB family protein [Firmicutes bacterium]|nr:protease complex subunit PrcB family protein [Bacillota bacterium]
MTAPRCTVVRVDQAPPDVRSAAGGRLGQAGLHRLDTASGTFWLLSLGAQPTAGHRLAVSGVEPAEEPARWRVRVQHQPPAAGALHAQVLTHPHLLFRLDGELAEVWLEEPGGGRRIFASPPAPAGEAP